MLPRPGARVINLPYLLPNAPNIAEAAGTGRAEGAVDELSRFQDGLRATHENTTQSNNTVIGHSYGSTVVGHTAQSETGLNADEIILVGSPGADAQHASELGFLPENVHATTAKNDGITGLTDLTHGADPTSPDFGSTLFESDEGSPDGAWPLRNAHSETPTQNTSRKITLRWSVWERSLPERMRVIKKMTRLKITAFTTIAALILTACSTGCGGRVGMEETITQDEAVTKIEQHISDATAALPGTVELEPLGPVTFASCDDPTDGGSKDRVTVGVSYWILDLKTEENDINVDLLHKYWTENGYRVLTDSRPDDLFVSVEHKEDSFVMSVQESIQGSLSIGASSPCVWPEGTPNP